MDFDDIQDENLKKNVTAAFNNSMNPAQVPDVFGSIVFDYLTSAQTGEFYRSILPNNCQVMLEYFGILFAHIDKNNGYHADNRQFHDGIFAELSLVLNDRRLSPLERVQVVLACGNLTYLLHHLIDFANYPYHRKNDGSTNGTTTIS